MQNISAGTLKGIDISKWDGTVDFSKVKASGVKVVYIKATEGTTYTDPMFESHYAGAKAQGLSIGFYHYFLPSTIENAKAQAQHFASKVNNKTYECRLALDLESTGGLDKTTLSKLAVTFLEELKAITGKEVVVYTYTSFAQTSITSILGVYPLWIAHYGVTTPGNNPIWTSWIGFQYTESGSVPGINGNCDLDVFTDDILLVAPPPPSTIVANAVIVNDWLYTRDSAGNIISGRVDIGDKVEVLDINYDKQLAYMKYPTPTGDKTAYTTNATNCISYYYQDQWSNGSTNETVYFDSACTQPIGTLYPYEKATPLFRKNGVLKVVYDTSKGPNTKCGYVKYNGGFTKF